MVHEEPWVAPESRIPIKAADTPGLEFCAREVGDDLLQVLRSDPGQVDIHPLFPEGLIDLVVGLAGDEGGELEARPDELERDPDVHPVALFAARARLDLNAKVLAAEARRYEAEIKYQQVLKLSKEPGGAMSLPEVINNKLVQDLKTQQGAIAKQIAEQRDRVRRFEEGAEGIKAVNLDDLFAQIQAGRIKELRIIRTPNEDFFRTWIPYGP